MLQRPFPTKYKNILFRSRLEARWAAYFDLDKIPWDYEPAINFSGWIPDFSLTMGRLKVYIEIKPVDLYYKIPMRGLEKPFAKAINHCKGIYLLLLGLEPIYDYTEVLSIPGILITDTDDSADHIKSVKTLEEMLARKSDKAMEQWREAGNLTRWKKPKIRKRKH